MHESSEPAAKRQKNILKTVIREKATPKPKASKPSAKKSKKVRTKKREDSGSPGGSAIPIGERRRSGRAHAISSYTERDDADDDEDMLDGVAEWEYENKDSGSEAASGDEEDEDDAASENEASEAEDEDDAPQNVKKTTANGKAQAPRGARGRGRKADVSDVDED